MRRSNPSAAAAGARLYCERRAIQLLPVKNGPELRVDGSAAASISAVGTDTFVVSDRFRGVMSGTRIVARYTCTVGHRLGDRYKLIEFRFHVDSS